MFTVRVPVQKIAGDPQKRPKMRVPVQLLDRDPQAYLKRLEMQYKSDTAERRAKGQLGGRSAVIAGIDNFVELPGI